MEGQQKVTKQQKNEVIVTLNNKETELRNAEKDLDTLRAELKKQENQFDRQKTRTEEYQSKYNELQVKYTKAQELLSNANRIVKTNAGRQKELEEENARLEGVLRNMSHGNVPFAPQQQTIIVQKEEQQVAQRVK